MLGKRQKGAWTLCTDDLGPVVFFNTNEYKEAFHVPTEIPWHFCGGISYTKTPEGTYYLYKDMIEAGYRIWHYSGTTDAAVAYQGTEYWLDKMLEEGTLTIQEDYRPWFNLFEHD